jgi:hypothetical protein
MNTAKMITDHELVMAFSSARHEGKKVFQATMTPGAHPLHATAVETQHLSATEWKHGD